MVLKRDPPSSLFGWPEKPAGGPARISTVHPNSGSMQSPGPFPCRHRTQINRRVLPVLRDSVHSSVLALDWIVNVYPMAINEIVQWPKFIDRDTSLLPMSCRVDEVPSRPMIQRGCSPRPVLKRDPQLEVRDSCADKEKIVNNSLILQSHEFCHVLRRRGAKGEYLIVHRFPVDGTSHLGLVGFPKVVHFRVAHVVSRKLR